MLNFYIVPAINSVQKFLVYVEAVHLNHILLQQEVFISFLNVNPNKLENS